MKKFSFTRASVFMFFGTFSIYLAGLFHGMFYWWIEFILTFLLVFIGLNLFFDAYKILAKIYSILMNAYIAAKSNEKIGQLNDGDKQVLEQFNGSIIEKDYNEIKREGILNLP